jgi:hypothetical protein
MLLTSLFKIRHRAFVPLFTLCLVLLTPFSAAQSIHHALDITLEPEEHAIEVTDTMTVKNVHQLARDGRLYFFLLADLEPALVEGGAWRLTRLAEIVPEHLGVTREDLPADQSFREYSLSLPGGQNLPPDITLTLSYRGKINFPLEEEEENYAKSFQRTTGTINAEGVMLQGGTFWYPWFFDQLVSFDARISLPEGWDAVCQGERTGHEKKAGRQTVRWTSPEPTDEIYLVAGRYTVYERPVGPIMTYAYLRTPDEKLAATYLDANEKYFPMYERLIGPYPYKSFALVENFWETGYGMPAFTLLGPKVIRLPFIPVSSYPHEILHNWWGNGVFVDWEKGNWCEGITAYMADHLIKEQHGQGADYRKATLQKYLEYVKKARDFPLTEFRERHSSASEAIGYGKSLMAFHMMRRRLGDETFIEGFRHFYRTNLFKRAEFDEIRQSMESVSGEDLGWFFHQWIERTGAPELAMDPAEVLAQGGKYLLKVVVRQTQDGPAFRLAVPAAVILEGRKEPLLLSLEMTEKCGVIEAETAERPLEVRLDPRFDVFRKLHPKEIPPSLSRTFGADRVLVVLPESEAGTPMGDAYRAMAEKWAADDPARVLIRSDHEAAAGDMAGRSLWILGRRNRFFKQIEKALEAYPVSISEKDVRMGNSTVPWRNHTAVMTVAHPGNPDLSATWYVVDPPAALPGLERKLPFYGKYSYLAFEGDEPTNILKGRWPQEGSPLRRAVTYPGETPAAAQVDFPPAQPLIGEESLFSVKGLEETVAYLSSERMSGRGLGTPELEQAAMYIAERFRAAGLRPGGDDGTYIQSWVESRVKDKENVPMKNVIGILPGKKEDWSAESVVIGAHYDHLGYGWPEARAGHEGEIYPGADDNASGVAIMLALADVLGKSAGPERTLIFIAFSGEESGLVGSRYYLSHSGDYPPEKMMAMINLDSVGRLEGRKLQVFGTESAREMIHIVMGCGFVTGLQTEAVRGEPGAGDHLSFLDRGIPALHFFSGAHVNYHRPSDTADKIDYPGMVRIAEFAKEAAGYFSSREEPLTVTITGDEKKAPPKGHPGGGTKRAFLGTVPDFAFTGEGVRVSEVVPDSPAQQAGLKAGDVLLRIDETSIKTLRDYANFLKSHAPGDAVTVFCLRDGEEEEIQVILGTR